MVHEKKLQVTDQVLGSDVNRLTFLWMSICERQRNYRDYTRNELRNALREAAACLPVYRTYIRAQEGQVSDRDITYIDDAIQFAKGNRPDLDPRLFDFLGDLLRLRFPGELENEFVMRFQQFTGPVMAKGVEDTAFYNYYRLISLNEVGGDPGQFGLSIEEWHNACLKTQERWGNSLLASSTHDTKRSEDVRARINLLSEIPAAWTKAVRRWAQINAAHKTGQMPDRNDEYMLYQVLVGAWPIDLERLQPYLEKAAREAKVHSSWTDPDPEYEAALINFAEDSLQDEVFRQDLESFVGELILPGRINALAGLLLKLTAPGIPDIYQGAELWTDSLVDPDNRRPVDYRLRWRLLEKLQDGTPPEVVLEGMEAGLPKLWTVRQALRLRRERPDCFGPHSTYTPLPVQGEPGQPEHAVAYLRGEQVAVIVPRLVMDREKTWPETYVSLPSGYWLNILTGEAVEGGSLPLSIVLKRFPVALLCKD
jgi:(1->4)-alpha-D-glucan 1-alpha-D-glucosylmutase